MSDTTTKPGASSQPAPAPRRAKLFKNGRSQAVRLPKEFGLKAMKLRSGGMNRPVRSS